MKFFKKKIGDNGAQATFYLQEANSEIDINRKYPMMVIVPGGAYLWTSWREEEPIALEFLGKGFSCVVFEYATEGLAFYEEPIDYTKNPASSFPNPIVDLTKTLAYIRENADEWNIDFNSINVMGFSAGGNLVAQLGVYWKEEWLENLSNITCDQYQPNSICLAYAAVNIVSDLREQKPERITFATLGKEISQQRADMVNVMDKANKNVPPTFIWHTMEDPYVPADGALKFALGLHQNCVPYEIHLYQKGKHGLGLADYRTDSKANRSQSDNQASSWIDLYLGWLEKNNLRKI